MWNTQDPPEGELLFLTVLRKDGKRAVTTGFFEDEWHVAGWDEKEGCMCEIEAEVLAWMRLPAHYTK